MEKITIFIPSYNSADYIENAVASVLNQTYQGFKLVIIDDGSSDDSIKILRRYESDPRVQIISDGENKGLIERLNQSISLCDTEFYVRMDNDDIMFPNRLEAQMAVLDHNPQLQLVHSAAVSINNKNEILGLRKEFKPGKLNIIHPSVMARTSFYKNNLYDAAYPLMEDHELWRRTYHPDIFFYEPRPLLFYREDGGIISGKHQKMLPSLLKFTKKYDGSSVMKFARVIVVNRMKVVAFKTAEILGFSIKLIQQRYRKLKNDDLLSYRQILAKAISPN